MRDFGLTCTERLAFRWKRRESLTETWRTLADGERETALAFWLEASTFDMWTFDELKRLLRDCRDADHVPPALADWGLAVASEEVGPPVRRGRRTDYAEDLHVMMAVVFRRFYRDETVHAACQAVAEAENRSYEAVRRAYERGNRWPLSLDQNRLN